MRRRGREKEGLIGALPAEPERSGRGRSRRRAVNGNGTDEWKDNGEANAGAERDGGGHVGNDGSEVGHTIDDGVALAKGLNGHGTSGDSVSAPEVMIQGILLRAADDSRLLRYHGPE